jgi:hypothetical protein
VALDLTSEGLWDEVRKGVEHRDKFLGQPYETSIAAFVGPGYRLGTYGDVDFDNHAYKYLSLFLPILASGNPRIRTKTPRQGSAAALAKAVQLAVNRNFELTNAKRTIEQLGTDWVFKYCVAMTTPRPVMGMLEREDPPYRPVTKRMSLTDYVWDPVAIQHAECRFQAHRIIRDVDSLQREAKEQPNRGWDQQAIALLSTPPERKGRGEELNETYDRNEIEFWEIWVPEAELDSAKDEKGRKFTPEAQRGFHGTIYTVGRNGGELRAPRPFWGPRDGPYTFSGYLYVPDRVVSLSPLAANAAQAEIHNSVWAAAVASIRNYKKGIAISSSSAADIAEKISEFNDQGIFELESHEDIDKVIRDVEKGGITAQHLQMLQLLRNNLEQSSGLTEAAQGQATGASTATEASIASMSSNKRMGYMAEKFITSVVKPIAQKEAWYLAMHPLSRIALGPEAEGVFHDDVTGEPIEYPVLNGGMDSADLLEDMDIEVEPISMRATSELLEAEMSAQQDQWLATFAPLIPQLPWVEWDQVLARKAENWRDPSWARIVNLPKAMAFGQMMMKMNLQGIQGGEQTPQPRLAADFKPFQALKSSESPAGFSRNARPASNAARGQANKAPRAPGTSSTTSSNQSQVNP